jgi:trehalose 6-phosphate phosphatase
MNRSLFELQTAVRSHLSSERRVLLLSDFDGTLTPIVAHPGEVVLMPEERRLLVELARRPRFVVAILSGRSLDDVRARVGVDGLIYGGNHGLEIHGPGVHFVEPTAAAIAPTLRELTDALHGALASIPGVLVENKHLTASVHVRQARESSRAEVLEAVHVMVRARGGRFRVTIGQAVFEIRPAVAWDKGAAGLWIRHRAAADADPICVLGDDRTDEDTFRALPDAVTIKIGEGTPTAARYILPSPADAAVFLSWLLEVTDSTRDRLHERR